MTIQDNGIKTSEDAVLGGRVTICQPAAGYRAAVDPVLLAAAVPARAGDKVLDAGAGVGTAALCLAARVSGVRLAGIERDETSAELAAHNAKINGADIEIVRGDIVAPPPALQPGSFDHVMCNPPYLSEAHGHPPPEARKKAATREEAKLEDWIAFAQLMLKRKGTLTMIYRADRLDALLAALYGAFGDIAVFPLWPKSAADGNGNPENAKAAKRVIVRARKGLSSPLALLPGLVLHKPDGAYTPEAERILRGGEGLVL
ncbi:MAG: methyltransferase [Rhodospirillales bacterium]